MTRFRDNNGILNLLNLKLNPDMGRVVVNYGGSLSWQECLDRVLVGDTRLGHISTGS